MSQYNTQQELFAHIKQLEEQVSFLKRTKKYGLTWENKTEDIVLSCDHNIPVLKEFKNRKVLTNNSLPDNLLIEGDNYHSLSVLNYTHKGKIDLIYIDPPFFSGRNYNQIWGDDNEIRTFHDIWEDGLPSYLVWLNARLWEMRRVLKDKGSIYVHCDWQIGRAHV